MKVRYIPNILSALRIVMALAFCIVFLFFDRWVAVSIFIAAGITDILDGYLARRFSWISDAGKILDPLADKTMQLSVLISCVSEEIIPLWLLFLIVIKEVIMGIGSVIYYKRTKSIGVSENYGKTYTVLFYIAVAAFIVFEDWFSVHNLVKYALCILVAFSGLFAIVLYYKSYFRK